MIQIAPAIAFARGNWKLIGVGVLIVALIAGVLVFKLIWLPAHDRAVRAEYYAELLQKAQQESKKAETRADKASAERKVQTDETQDRISNSSGVDELFERLRGQGGTK